MERIKLSEIAYLLNGYAFKSAKYVERGIRIIRIANVQDGYIADHKPCYYPLCTDEDISKYMLTENDLLISLTGNVGRVGMLTKGFLPAALNQRVSCIRIKDSDTVNKKYLYYYFRQKLFIQECVEASKGVAQLNLSNKWLENYTIPVPPLPEQERIVARIEELFSQLDAGVETLKKTKAQLVVYRQAVLKEAFEGRLTASGPEKIVLLGDYIETPRYGTSKKCSYDDGRDRTAVYRIPNIEHKNGRISHDDIKYAQFTESELDGIRLQQGDILIIRSNGSVSLVGRAAMVCDADITGTFAGYLMRLRISEPETLLPKFLLLFLQSHQARIYIENKAKSTSGVHNINSTEISDLQIPLYDPDTQYAIIEAIESRLSVCDSIEHTVDTALQQAEAMRQSILKDAFEGRL